MNISVKYPDTFNGVTRMIVAVVLEIFAIVIGEAGAGLLGNASGVSDIATTQFGYHIIYKADEKGGHAQTLVDVHDKIKDLLRHEARGRAMDAYVADLRAAAKIEYADEKPPAHSCSCGHDHPHSR